MWSCMRVFFLISVLKKPKCDQRHTSSPLPPLLRGERGGARSEKPILRGGAAKNRALKLRCVGVTKHKMVAKSSFVVATPVHCHFDEDKARVLAKHGLLHFVAKGTRRGTRRTCRKELTRLNPKIGLVFTAAAMTFRTFVGEVGAVSHQPVV